MTKNFWFAFFLSLIIGLGACTRNEKESFHSNESVEVKIEDVADDILIPSRAWDVLANFSGDANTHVATPEGHGEAAPSAGGHGDKKGGEGAAGIAGGTTPSFLFSGVNVYLTEKNPKVLNSPSFKIELPKGGGTIDLASYVGKQIGSFYVGFEFPEWGQITGFKGIFVSHALKRNIRGNIHGAGCNKYIDISTQFQKNMKSDGLKVNTLDARHSTVLGGNFIFSAQKGIEHFITQVTFTDSSNKRLFCIK